MFASSVHHTVCFAGSSSDYSEKFHVMADGQSLYFPNRRAIRVWDLKHNRMASALLHVNFVSKLSGRFL